MADPTKFEPGFDYSAFEASNPTSPKPGAKLDDDFDNIALSVDETIDALKDVRRSDGKLNNHIVTKDSLAPDALALIAAGGSPRGAWTPDTFYNAKDLVSEANVTYIAVVAHTSSDDFETDLTAGKWMVFSSGAEFGDGAYFEYFSGTGDEQTITLGQSFGTDELSVEVYAKNNTTGNFERIDPADYTLDGDQLTGTFPNGVRTILVFSPSTAIAAAVNTATDAADAAAASETAAAASETAAAASAAAADASADLATDLVATIAYSIVDSMAALRAISAANAAAKPTAFLRGYYAVNDGGGGPFFWMADDDRDDDGGVIINPTGNAGDGRWVRQFSGPLHDLWYGVKADTTDFTIGTDNTAALQAVEDAADALGVLAIYYPPRPLARGFKSTITTYPCVRHTGIGSNQQGLTVNNGSTLTFVPTVAATYGFKLELPDGLESIQAPSWIGLNLNGDYIIKLNDPGNGFTDTAGSQQYMGNFVVEDCRFQAVNFNTSGTEAIQVSKGRQAYIRRNAFLGYDRAIHVEGLDEVHIRENSIQGGVQSSIFADAHGTFGNDLYIVGNFINNLVDGAKAFLDISYRSCAIEKNFFEGSGNYDAVISLGGGFSARVRDNEIGIANSAADFWLDVANGYLYVDVQGNSLSGSLNSLRARFNSDNGYPFFDGNGARVRVRHHGNFQHNGDNGFPFNSVASTLDAGHLPPGVLARFTPNLDGLNFAALGQTVLCKGGAFILSSTGSSNYLEFSNTDFPALGETVDLWVLALQASGGPGSLNGALLDYATGAPTTYGTVSVPSNVTWLKVKSGTSGSFSKGCRIYSGVAGLQVFEAALVKQSYPTS